MTAEQNERFLAERKSGIGGSDAHHLFDLPPYGCRRLLWYEKTGATPDYCHSETTEDLFERGHALEPLVADKYVRVTGRTLRVEERASRHPDHPELMVHVDRMIMPDADCPDPESEGVWECKTCNREVFHKIKRDGMQAGHILQLQHGIGIKRATWGAFSVLWPDAWQMLHFDMLRDADLVEQLRVAGTEFWQHVQSGFAPDPLPASDKRCSRCLYRTSCQGAALLEIAEGGDGPAVTDNGLVDITSEFLELREIRDEAKGLFEECSDRLKAQLGDRVAVDTTGARILYRPQTSMRLNQPAFKKAHPEIHKQFTQESISRPLRVFPT